MTFRIAPSLGLAALLAAGAANGQGAAPVAATPAISPGLQGAIDMAQLFSPSAKVMTSGTVAYLTLATTPGRTQNVYIYASVFGPAGAPTRLIGSTAAKLTSPFDQALLIRLLQENQSSLPYGYWTLSAPASDGSRTVSYQIEMRTDAPASAVQAAMTTAANRADALEAQLGPTDTY